MPPQQAMSTGNNVSSNVANLYPSKHSNSSQQQPSMHNPIKKQHKPHPMQQFIKLDSASTTPPNTVCESVVESSTQTINVVDEMMSSNMLDASYQDEGMFTIMQ